MAKKQENILQVQEEDRKLGHKYRKQSFCDIMKQLQKDLVDPQTRELVEVACIKLQAVCDEVGHYIEDVPRGMNVSNPGLRDVFEQLAECIRDLPSSPITSVQRACVARYDASRIPELSTETRRAGYEEGYRDARKASATVAGEFDFDLD